jgi:hypothetical protein
MAKKVLICEDDTNTAYVISEYGKIYGYDPIEFVKESEPRSVIDNLEEKIKEENPCGIIFDGLNGLCFEGIKIAKNLDPKIKIMIYSGTMDIVKEAEKEGIKGILKPTKDYKELFSYFN